MMRTPRTASASARTKSSGPPSRAFSRSGTGYNGSNAAPPLPSSAANAVPTGRIEMLVWLESKCGRAVETIEGLRDGVSYAMVLADIIGTAADIAVSSKGPTAYDIVDHKIDRKIGPTVMSQQPQADSIQVTEACERNLLALQTMIRSCVPKRFGMEMDVPKMAKGMMQDHMLFLRWLVGLPKKIPAGDAAGQNDFNNPESMPAAVSARNGGAAGASAAPSTPTASRQQAQQRTAPPRAGATGATATVGAAGRSPNEPAAEATIISALLSIQREIEQLEKEAIAKGAAASNPDSNQNSALTPPITFADVQARTEHRDALADTLTSIAELVKMSAAKARQDKMPTCPLQMELQRVFAASNGKR